MLLKLQKVFQLNFRE